MQGEKDRLYYLTKAKDKLAICINNSNHSPEFKQSLIKQLQELQNMTASRTGITPKSKKCLDFQAPMPEIDVGIDESTMYTTNSTDVSNVFENSMLQEQLDAKESENRNLKQALAMYRAQIDLQRQQQVGVPPGQQIIQPHMLMQQQQHIYRTSSNGSNPMTPTVQNGLETPSDMWWDSFSPQPSFEPSIEKGYFSGLAQHVEQIREESGEGEAPTLKDQVDSTPGNKSATNVSVNTPSSPVYETDDIYVEPIVKLSSRNDLVTGEEDEVLKFIHRAKLYRFDKDASQWKERGIGDVKILYNEISKKARITMRREQVLRLCCNHVITSEMKLEGKAGAKSAWSWFTAADATDVDVKPEQFTIKFKTQEIAEQFKAAFILCQEQSSREQQSAREQPSAISQDINIAANKDTNTQEMKHSLTSKVAPEPGSWSCEICLVSNPPDSLNCLACQTPKPGYVVLGNTSAAGTVFGQLQDDTALNISNQPSVFKFGVSQNTTDGVPGHVPYQQQNINVIATPPQGTQVISQQQTDFRFGYATPVIQQPLMPQPNLTAIPQNQPAPFGIPQAAAPQMIANRLPSFQWLGDAHPMVPLEPGASAAPFIFKTPENAITESPEGKPIFSFATSQNQQPNVDAANPFLAANASLAHVNVSSVPMQGNTGSVQVSCDHVQVQPADSTVGFPPFNVKPNTFTDSPVEAKIESTTKRSPFAGFSFKVNSTTTVVATTNSLVSSTSDVVYSESSSPFSGFSFSGKSGETVVATKPTTPVKSSITQNFPMMSSLLQESSTPPVQQATAQSPVIAGMDTLPVFEKGVVKCNVDPSSFWTASSSSQKPFFTGNTTALESIGHKAQEEPRVVDEEEFFNDYLKASNEVEDEAKEFDDAGYYYEENGEYDYNCNDEDYGDNYEDYDPDEDSDSENEVEPEYQPSPASSSRKGSADYIDADNDLDVGALVEER